MNTNIMSILFSAYLFHSGGAALLTAEHPDPENSIRKYKKTYYKKLKFVRQYNLDIKQKINMTEKKGVFHMTSLQHTASISFPFRLTLYIAGGIILAFGITLNTKTLLGVSPIISIPYAISVIGDFPLGVVTFIFYAFCIFMQFVLLQKEFEKIRLCQIFMSFVTSLFIQIFDHLLPTPESFSLRLVILAAAIILTGIGAAMTVAMQICPNPADGLAEVIGRKCRKNLGFGKNLFDLIGILISLSLGFIFRHHIIGIGIGTILSMIFTGRVIALLQKPLDHLTRLR